MGVYDGFGAMMGNYFGQLGASQGYQQAQKQNSDSQAQMMEALFNIAGMHAKSVQWAQEQEARRQQNQQEVDYRNRQLQFEQDRAMYGQQRNERLDALSLALQGIDPDTDPAVIAAARREAIEEGKRIGKYGEYSAGGQMKADEATKVADLFAGLNDPSTAKSSATALGLMGLPAPLPAEAGGSSWWDSLAGEVRNSLFGGAGQGFRASTGMTEDRFDARRAQMKEYIATIRSMMSRPDLARMMTPDMTQRAAEYMDEIGKLDAAKQKFISEYKGPSRAWMNAIPGVPAYVTARTLAPKTSLEELLRKITPDM